MTVDTAELNRIRVASPCNVAWDSMKGDDQVRFCGRCQQSVFNLSAMSLDEIASLVSRKEGKMCVRFYRRFDGTVLVDDCPVGLRALRRKVAVIAGAVAAMLALVTGGIVGLRPEHLDPVRRSWFGRLPPVKTMLAWIAPVPPPQRVWMGEPMPLNLAPRCSRPEGAPGPQQQVEMGKVSLPARAR